MTTLDKLVPNREECARLRGELGKLEFLVLCMLLMIEIKCILLSGGTCMAPGVFDKIGS